jgi:hypothetical protein
MATGLRLARAPLSTGSLQGSKAPVQILDGLDEEVEILIRNKVPRLEAAQAPDSLGLAGHSLSSGTPAP